MSSSPAAQSTINPKEQPILDNVLAIRDRLMVLKQDRSTYIKSRDVVGLYNRIVEQLEDLNVIRAENKSAQTGGR